MPNENIPAPASSEELRAALASLLATEKFKVGQLVRWKKDLQNKEAPDLMIVVALLPKAIPNTCRDAASPYYGEPIDIICGSFVASHDSDTSTFKRAFLSYHYDSHRLTSAEV